MAILFAQAINNMFSCDIICNLLLILQPFLMSFSYHVADLSHQLHPNSWRDFRSALPFLESEHF